MWKDYYSARVYNNLTKKILNESCGKVNRLAKRFEYIISEIIGGVAYMRIFYILSIQKYNTYISI